MSKPVTFVDVGGIPVTEVATGGVPVAEVTVGGQPMTRVSVGGMPIVNVSGTAFTPASLFASGEEGAWYEPSTTTCFTDTGGTTPASVGDAVARINDSSGNGNHATQATATARPILRQTAGGLYYLEFDGVDDSMAVTYPSAFSAITRSAAYRSVGISRFILDDDTAANSCSLWATTTDGNMRLFNVSGITATGGWVWGSDEVVVGTVSAAGAAEISGSGNSATGTISAPTTNGLRLGAVGTASSFLLGRIYGVVDINRVLTVEEQANLKTYLAGLNGVTL